MATRPEVQASQVFSRWMKEKSSGKKSANKVTVQQADELGSFYSH